MSTQGTNKWNLIVDVAKCDGCRNCFLANRDEYVDNDFPGYSAPQPKHGHAWIDIKRKERGQGTAMDVAYLPTMCMHCDDAPCIQAAPDAVTKRPDGIVLIDPVKAKGRQDLVEACPYGAIWWNDDLELPQAWTFDAHLLDRGWTEPRGAQVCATRAMTALKTSDEAMARHAATEGLEVFEPELGAKPRVWYRNLHRFTMAFIAGTVAAERGGVVDCVVGASVVLRRDGDDMMHTETDAFGDFKFDGLAPDSGAYQVAVSHPDWDDATAPAELGESVTVGEIMLTNKA